MAGHLPAISQVHFQMASMLITMSQNKVSIFIFLENFMSF
jgi:hypothetical protein